DIKMPEMDGLQAARWIAQRRGPKGRPRLIAMTANSMPGDREAYLAAGMDGYVPKPIDLGDLAAALAPAVATLGRDARPDGSSGSDEVLDADRLAHLHAMQDNSQPSLVGELIDMFVADSPGHLAALAQALDATDAPQLGRLAHRFLSVTQNIGARRMSRLCMEIENLCLHGRLEPARHLLGALEQERERVLAALLATRHRY
ncbi:MAG: Hpt domain-containing protein, partial [Rhizobacter sp.]|nr:Hpt domain-containing protein [Rhizobacter sp.]